MGGFTGPSQDGLIGFIEQIYYMLSTTGIALLIAIATVVFLFGIVRYVAAGGDEDKVREGRNMMLFGVIALSVMIGMWGLVKIIVDTAGFGGVEQPENIGDL